MQNRKRKIPITRIITYAAIVSVAIGFENCTKGGGWGWIIGGVVAFVTSLVEADNERRRGPFDN